MSSSSSSSNWRKTGRLPAFEPVAEAMAEVEAIGPSSLGLMLFEERWTDWIGECSDTAFGEPDTAGESLSGVAIARLAA